MSSNTSVLQAVTADICKSVDIGSIYEQRSQTRLSVDGSTTISRVSLSLVSPFKAKFIVFRVTILYGLREEHGNFHLACYNGEGFIFIVLHHCVITM